MNKYVSRIYSITILMLFTLSCGHTKHIGVIVAWGGNHRGQCDVPSPNDCFVDVAAGWGHSLGLRTDSSIVAWGFEWIGTFDLTVQPNAMYLIQTITLWL